MKKSDAATLVGSTHLMVVSVDKVPPGRGERPDLRERRCHGTVDVLGMTPGRSGIDSTKPRVGGNLDRKSMNRQF
jgi:hypothetical protein